jgi:hypothetical protein
MGKSPLLRAETARSPGKAMSGEHGLRHVLG